MSEHVKFINPGFRLEDDQATAEIFLFILITMAMAYTMRITTVFIA